MEYSVGQVVFAKSGHDSGMAFIITDMDEDFLYLTDGRNRTVDKPKKKKRKHVQVTNYSDAEIKKKILNGESLLDADFRKALKRYSCQDRAQ